MNNQLIYNQIEEYLHFCRYERNMTKQTMESKRSVLYQFARQIKEIDIQEFTTEDFKKWRKDLLLSGTVSARTINTRASHVISMSKYLKDEGYTIQLQFTKLYKLEEDPPRQNFFTREQIDQAKEHADRFSWLLISLAFDSGLRLSELQNLRLENIEDRTMKIIGKGRKAGQLFMSEETRERLDKWIELRRIDDYLWPSPVREDGGPYSTDELRYHMRKPFKRAGIKGFYPHALRHSFGTDLEINGAPMRVTQKLMRHSNMATTEKYLHGLSSQKMERMYDKFKAGAAVEEPVEENYDDLAMATLELVSA